VIARRIVVIGASSGGIEALRHVVAGLPADFPAAVCAVVHTAAESPGVLDAILARAGAVPASTAVNGQRLKAGHIYVAPPDHHLLVEPGLLVVTRGPKENRFRPAIDPLFRAAAQVFGPAAIGVVLTGSLDDGTAGLWAIKQLGGIAIVQDPADASFPSMPESAIRHVAVDHVRSLHEIAPLLVRTVAAPVDERAAPSASEHLDIEVHIAKERNPVDAGLERISAPSPFACPECGGVLMKVNDTKLLRFRCHTGHAYSVESLVGAISEAIEESLWGAVRALQEGGFLMQHLSDHLRVNHHTTPAMHIEAQAGEARRQADIVRELVMTRTALTTTKP
jgi:two-component system, chemotaxis family, protein-glutamate methylesterase/glutaminase